MNRIPYATFLPRLEADGVKRWNEIVEVVKPDTAGPWIVGGAVRRLIDGQPQTSDVDRLTFGASTIRRMLKYGKQGFTFCQGTIVSVLEEVGKDPTLIHGDMAYVD